MSFKATLWKSAQLLSDDAVFAHFAHFAHFCNYAQIQSMAKSQSNVFTLQLHFLLCLILENVLILSTHQFLFRSLGSNHIWLILKVKCAFFRQIFYPDDIEKTV